MKQLITAILASALLCSCAYMTASTTRTTTIGTNGVPIVTETTHGTTYALFDSQASLAKVQVHSGYATNTNGTFSPGINAAGISSSASSSNAVLIINGAAGIISKIPF